MDYLYMKKKRIIVISSLSRSLVNFRLDLLKNLINQGYDVIALAPDQNETVIDTLNSIGVSFRTFSLERTGFSFISDMKTVRSLRKLYLELQPTYIFAYTAKPVIYGNLAKLGLNIPSLSWITGLGFYGLDSNGLKDKVAKSIMTLLYKVAFKRNDIILFQNIDDVDFFKKKKILKKQRYRVTPGSGINLDTYSYSEPTTDIVKFIFVGRLIKSKGIRLFIEAAKILKTRYDKVEFIVAGGLDLENPDAIQKEEIELLKEKNTIRYLGYVDNVIDLVKKSSVFVLPSTYREGVPRSILEALSTGRPIITTDNVGCRETVVKDYNGVLIKKDDLVELVSAMCFFCDNRSLIIEYGKNSRKMAENKFDVKIVNNIVSECLKSL